MKNICFLLASLEAGGLENYLVRFIEHVPQGKYNILIICRSGHTGILTSRAEEGGSRVAVVPSGHFNLVAWWKMYRMFSEHRTASMCDFTGNFGALPLLIGKMAGVRTRIAYYPRSSNAFRPTLVNRLVNKLFNKGVCSFATRIIANSNAGLQYFFQNTPFDDRFEVIYNGIDAEQFLENQPSSHIREELNIPPNAFVIGHVGRYNVAKNHPSIIAIAERVIVKNDNVFFLFCGKGTEQVLSLIHDQSVRGKIKVLGYRSDVAQVLRAMDLFLFPSITEGQPNALLEAMIAGLPFLCSNIPSILEAIPANHHGQTLAPMDIDGFADRINDLLKDPSQTANMTCSEAAMRRFDAGKNFSLLQKALDA